MITSAFLNGGLVSIITFTKSLSGSIFDKAINAGDDIKILKKCLEKTRNLKDEINYIEGSETIEIKEDSIILTTSYAKVIPEIEKIKAGYKDIYLSINPKKEIRTYRTYNDNFDYVEIDIDRIFEYTNINREYIGRYIDGDIE
jgi:hypothetical protein